MSDNGTFDRIAGKAKEAAGKVTGNKDTETEGKLQQAEGKIKEVAEDAKDAIKGAVKGDLSNYLYKKTKRSPMILPVIMEV